MADFRTTVKAWFKTTFTPTQTQFYFWLTNIWFKDEEIPVTSISGVNDLLSLKADKEYVDNLVGTIFSRITIEGNVFQFKSKSGNSLPTNPVEGDIAIHGYLSANEFGELLVYVSGEPSDINSWSIRKYYELTNIDEE